MTRHPHRRRRPRAWRILPAVGAIAAAIALLVLVPRGRGAPDQEVVTTVTPIPTAQHAPRDRQRRGTDTPESTLQSLGTVLGAFRRPVRNSDHVPRKANLAGLGRQLGITLDLDQARRLATDGPRALYLVPSLQNGHAGVCTVLLTDGGAPGSRGCGAFNPQTLNTHPRWSSMVARPAPVYSLLVPDGTTMVTLHLRSGQSRTEPVQDNAVLFVAKGLERMTWRDASGREFSARPTI
jgi:hypothetical protein